MLKKLVALIASWKFRKLIAACKFQFIGPGIDERHFQLVSPVADVSDMLVVSQKDLGGEDMRLTEIKAAIDCKGYRHATFAELLAYAKAKWNGKGIVVALGSAWVFPKGFRDAPYLCGDGDGRGLYRDWGDTWHRWDGDDLFLVVRE